MNEVVNLTVGMKGYAQSLIIDYLVHAQKGFMAKDVN